MCTKSVWNYRFFVCQPHRPTFNVHASLPLKSKNFGSRSGLQLKLNATNASAGIDVYIGNHSVDVLTDPRFISPGLQTTFVIKRTFEKRPPAPYSNCLANVTGSVKLERLNKVYYQSECISYCRYYLIAEKCNMLEQFLEFSDFYYSSFKKAYFEAYITFAWLHFWANFYEA